MLEEFLGFIAELNGWVCPRVPGNPTSKSPADAVLKTQSREIRLLVDNLDAGRETVVFRFLTSAGHAVYPLILYSLKS